MCNLNQPCEKCLTAPCKSCEKIPVTMCVQCAFFRDVPNIPQGGVCTKKSGIASHTTYESACRYGIECVVY